MTHPDFDGEVQTEAKVETKLPSMYKVVLHNDDKTTVEFVIAMLMTVFHKDLDAATQITLDVHHNGRGIAGLFTKEIAQQKTVEATRMAESHHFPLKITYEED